jgi:hypothetical protein
VCPSDAGHKSFVFELKSTWRLGPFNAGVSMGSNPPVPAEANAYPNSWSSIDDNRWAKASHESNHAFPICLQDVTD